MTDFWWEKNERGFMAQQVPRFNSKTVF